MIILGYDPPSITVRLDPLITKTVPIQVDHGEVPAGLNPSPPVLSVPNAVVSGPESVVRLVTSAEARVVVQPSGIDVDQTVDLVAVDARGEVQSPVKIEPSSVHVQISVGSGRQNKTVPVNRSSPGPLLPGSRSPRSRSARRWCRSKATPMGWPRWPAADSQPVSISGASTDLVRTVPLALPDGVDAISVASVSVTITLQPITGTRTFSSGIVLSGARDDRTYSLSTATVLVTVGGTVAALDALDPRTLAVVADVDGLAPGSHKVKLKISLPADVTLVAASPPEVTVTVAENASAPPVSPAPSPSGP